MKCFVIMPFGNRQTDPERKLHLDLLYEGLIKPAVESVRIPDRPAERITCHRGDKEPRPGEVITHIIENLVQSEFAIADLTGRNPNVFYELGVRHAVNDNTILIAQTEEDIPFDLRTQRYIIYSLDFAGGVQLRNALVEAIEDILRSPRKIDNPVRRYLFDREKEKIETKGTPPGYDVVKELLTEMTTLRREFNEQLEGVRRVMNAVTCQPSTSVVIEDSLSKLKRLEGCWRSSPDHSLMCARLIDGQLLVPYCYGSDTHLTAHIFNIHVLENNLFGRFAWLDSLGLSGYVFLRIEASDRLVGGWWFTGEVSPISGDITQIDLTAPGMKKWVLELLPKQSPPDWAENYFTNVDAVQALVRASAMP